MHATSLLMNNGDHVYDATDGIAISAKKLKKCLFQKILFNDPQICSIIIVILAKRISKTKRDFKHILTPSCIYEEKNYSCHLFPESDISFFLKSL